eukprot:TRINITY_DN18252_c0_g1_i3.p1 TRINITY_DN18252_c0_g1~~TRINITY_DN18252_c0_g1_i3.p1  ORF type:complete len:664 (+),score=211.04 TRINITY_DN18252_c0_g1_i3:60-1994(+)
MPLEAQQQQQRAVVEYWSYTPRAQGSPVGSVDTALLVRQVAARDNEIARLRNVIDATERQVEVDEDSVTEFLREKKREMLSEVQGLISSRDATIATLRGEVAALREELGRERAARRADARQVDAQRRAAAAASLSVPRSPPPAAECAARVQGQLQAALDRAEAAEGAAAALQQELRRAQCAAMTAESGHAAAAEEARHLHAELQVLRSSSPPRRVPPPQGPALSPAVPSPTVHPEAAAELALLREELSAVRGAAHGADELAARAAAAEQLLSQARSELSAEAAARAAAEQRVQELMAQMGNASAAVEQERARARDAEACAAEEARLRDEERRRTGERLRDAEERIAAAAAESGAAAAAERNEWSAERSAMLQDWERERQGLRETVESLQQQIEAARGPWEQLRDALAHNQQQLAELRGRCRADAERMELELERSRQEAAAQHAVAAEAAARARELELLLSDERAAASDARRAALDSEGKMRQLSLECAGMQSQSAALQAELRSLWQRRRGADLDFASGSCASGSVTQAGLAQRIQGARWVEQELGTVVRQLQSGALGADELRTQAAFMQDLAQYWVAQLQVVAPRGTSPPTARTSPPLGPHPGSASPLPPPPPRSPPRLSPTASPVRCGDPGQRISTVSGPELV